jgi:predicted nucleotide-binding protein
MAKKEKKFERRPNRAFPKHTLEDALVIAKAIVNKNAGKPMKKLLVADAIGRKPSTVQFRNLLSSSYKYGLTLGTEKAGHIELTTIGKSILKPLSAADELSAKQKAVLSAEKFNEIYTHYKDSKFPSGKFFENALEVQFGIPSEYIVEVNELLKKNGVFAGLIRDISGSPHVMFDNFSSVEESDYPREGKEIKENEVSPEEEVEIPEENQEKSNLVSSVKKKKVFITHGKNKAFIEPIKKLLRFGELEAVVSVEKQSVSQPVPDKVLNDMRSCGAAIIHVDAEEKLMDKEAKERVVINQNVLIEIGAAMALFGRRFILLVKEGITLPTNLQGLYEVRYNGEKLDGDVTIKLLEAINEMKNTLLPEDEVKK